MNNYKEGTKASYITAMLNLFLAIIKFIAGVIGRSSAMVADAIHTFSDIATTAVVIVGLKISNKEADKKHPYGHEKFEPECSKIVSSLLILTGIYLAYNSVKIIIYGNFTTPKSIAIYAALASIAIKEAMYWYTILVARKIKSISMEADAWHHRSDALSSIGTLIGIVGARMGFAILDPIAGLIVSFLVIKVGLEFYIKAVKSLVDESADENTIEKISDLALSVSGVESINDLKTRIFGNRIYVDIEIHVNKSISVEAGHNIAHSVHDIIEATLTEVKHCMVHIEPM